MMFHRLGLTHKNQRGFTLIELLIAIAITSVITGGITTAIFQTFTVNARTSSHMTAVRQVQNAGYWISHDTQMALNVDDNPTAPKILELTWTDWESGDLHQVVYTLLEDNKLQRSHSVNGTTETSIIAQYIDSTNTSCQFTDGVLMVTVTAAVGDFPEKASETRVYEIMPRPSS